MKVSGRDVLFALRDLEEDRRATSPLGGVPAAAIGRRVGGKDGRFVTGKLSRLEDAGLIRRVYPNLPRWASTERGKEVERLLSSCNAARGGTFRPYREVITDLTEILALAH